MRILIAEDETIIRLDLRKLLEEAGHDVCAEARDGAEAVALAEEHDPDLAILDVKMPRLDGIEAARRILEERPIPIVMLTAYGQDELVARAVGRRISCRRSARRERGTMSLRRYARRQTRSRTHSRPARRSSGRRAS